MEKKDRKEWWIDRFYDCYYMFVKIVINVLAILVALSYVDLLFLAFPKMVSLLKGEPWTESFSPILAFYPLAWIWLYIRYKQGKSVCNWVTLWAIPNYWVWAQYEPLKFAQLLDAPFGFFLGQGLRN